MTGLTPGFQLQLDLFRRQYLQLQADIRFPDPACLRQEEFQQALYDDLFGQYAVEYRPPPRYQLRILKELIKRIESSIVNDDEDILDDLVARLSSLLAFPIPSEAAAAQQRSYVTYTLSSLSSSKYPPMITLFEARSLVAATGTTGFRTWEACLHLGAYLSSPSCPFLLAEQNVLELGAGTGYLSILCAKYLNASHCTVTDGSDTVVDHLSTNYFLNDLEKSSLIESKELKWGQALLGGEQAEWNQGRRVDVVLGADVTYDSSVLPALVGTLVDLHEMFPAVKIIIAATVRNEETFKTFVRVCGMNGFMVDIIDFPFEPPEKQRGPFYCDETPVRLCDIKKGLGFEAKV